MNTSIADIPKRRGRQPSGGRKIGVLVRLPDETLQKVDAWAAKHDTNRPEAIRGLIEAAVKLGGLD